MRFGSNQLFESKFEVWGLYLFYSRFRFEFQGLEDDDDDAMMVMKTKV